MDAPRYRSDLPCDNIAKVPAARRILQNFQRLMPYHSRGGAIEQVIGRLNDGENEQVLVLAAETYAKWCKKVGKAPEYMVAPGTFYSLAGEWERFMDGSMPVVLQSAGKSDPGASRAAAVEAEMKANKDRIGQMPKDAQPERRSYKEMFEELRKQGKV